MNPLQHDSPALPSATPARLPFPAPKPPDQPTTPPAVGKPHVSPGRPESDPRLWAAVAADLAE
jgi:hypothetical protein